MKEGSVDDHDLEQITDLDETQSVVEDPLSDLQEQVWQDYDDEEFESDDGGEDWIN